MLQGSAEDGRKADPARKHLDPVFSAGNPGIFDLHLFIPRQDRPQPASWYLGKCKEAPEVERDSELVKEFRAKPHSPRPRSRVGQRRVLLISDTRHLASQTTARAGLGFPSPALTSLRHSIFAPSLCSHSKRNPCPCICDFFISRFGSAAILTY